MLKQEDTVSVSTMHVGVVGAGVMGRGVAQNLARSDFSVILVDVSETILDEARNEIFNNLRFMRLMSQADDEPSPENVMSRILCTIDTHAFSDTDFIIENVPEKMSVKSEVYHTLDGICPQQTIFVSNTSAIPITVIGELTKRPSQVIGVHFMNPVSMKTVVEVIPGVKTSVATIERTRSLLTGMGKEGILVKDSPGFVINRVFMQFINDAIALVHEKTATPEEIDKLFKSCLGHKMGPLETADLIGLDTVLDTLCVLRDQFKDDRFIPVALLAEMVEKGWLGEKSGRGFYVYQGRGIS